MDEYVIDPTAFERPLLDSRRRAALRTRVEQEARDRAKTFGVKVIAHEPRRVADVALLWFQGDRPSVLALVGGWTPTDAVRLHIAHAGPQGTRYELALYAVFDGEDDAGDGLDVADAPAGSTVARDDGGMSPSGDVPLGA